MDKNILIIAGEVSGDMRGAELLRRLKEHIPEVRFWGFGGDRLSKTGVELVEHINKLSVVGVWEVVVKLPLIFRQLALLRSEIRRRKPSLAVLIDYPGMNLRIARFLKRENIPVVYYITPQFWAWGKWRIRPFRAYVDLALCLFPFEERFFKEHGVSCSFVGHPLIEQLREQPSPERRSGLALALLPGSRKTEVETLLPIMLEAAEKIRSRTGELNIILAKTSSLNDSIYEDILADRDLPGLTTVTDDTLSALAGSDMAIIASGTATLEAALTGTPLIVTYRTSWLTALLFKLFADTSEIGLVNIVAGKKIAPELLQHNATADKLARETLSLLEDPTRQEAMKVELEKVKESLLGKIPSENAARAISEFWRDHTASM